MAVKHYNPRSVVIMLGPNKVEGIADGEFVTMERKEDAFNLYVGADGQGTRGATNNEAARVTITLSQSSPTNELFSILHALDKATGAGVLPLIVKDLFGTTLYTAATAWITRDPNGAYGKQIGTRQWIIETDKLVAFHGSAGDPPAAAA